MKAIFVIYLFLVILSENSFGQSQFKNNDRVCFLGNSITHNGHYYSYIYLYYATRFPEMRMSFINAGISGDTAFGMYNRLDEDVYANDATIVLLSAGMNDVNRSLYSLQKPVEDATKQKQEAIEKYKQNIIRLAESFRKHHLPFMFFTPTIYDETLDSPVESMLGVNAALGQCREILYNLAEEYQVPLIDFWLPMCRINDSIQQYNKSNTLTNKDRIHPEEPGHMVMAYLFLKQTNAPKLVWSASIDAKKNRIDENENCKITNLILKKKFISFKNTEFSLPFPLIAKAKEAYDLVPVNDSLNQQILKVCNLEKRKYRLKINHIEVGIYDALDFAQGINLALNTKTPQYVRSEEIANLCEDYFSETSLLRTLRRVEIVQLSGVNIDDKEAVRNYLNQYIEKMGSQKNETETHTAYYIKTAEIYLKEMDNKETIKRRIIGIEQLIYEINIPRTYHYVIQKI